MNARVCLYIDIDESEIQEVMNAMADAVPDRFRITDTSDTSEETVLSIIALEPVPKSWAKLDGGEFLVRALKNATHIAIPANTPPKKSRRKVAAKKPTKKERT